MFVVVCLLIENGMKSIDDFIIVIMKHPPPSFYPLEVIKKINYFFLSCRNCLLNICTLSITKDSNAKIIIIILI